VQYSLLDQRPKVKMEKAALDRDIKILAYGTLLGGFLSERWIKQNEPKVFETVSQQKVRILDEIHGEAGRRLDRD
jgi:aryl-alcohol dehydrogenase-like predicted oxidoreductase